MAQDTSPPKSILVRQEMAPPPERIWRALTQADLIETWLMETDFEPEVGRRFTFRAEPMQGWNGVTDCEVLKLVPERELAYRWDASGDQAEGGLKTVVSWVLTPKGDGTGVEMTHSGFRPEDEGGFQAMGAGWPRIVAKLEQVAAERG